MNVEQWKPLRNVDFYSIIAKICWSSYSTQLTTQVEALSSSSSSSYSQPSTSSCSWDTCSRYWSSCNPRHKKAHKIIDTVSPTKRNFIATNKKNESFNLSSLKIPHQLIPTVGWIVWSLLGSDSSPTSCKLLCSVTDSELDFASLHKSGIIMDTLGNSLHSHTQSPSSSFGVKGFMGCVHSSTVRPPNRPAFLSSFLPPTILCEAISASGPVRQV